MFDNGVQPNLTISHLDEVMLLWLEFDAVNENIKSWTPRFDHRTTLNFLLESTG